MSRTRYKSWTYEILCSSPALPITTLGRVLCAVLGTPVQDSIPWTWPGPLCVGSLFPCKKKEILLFREFVNSWNSQSILREQIREVIALSIGQKLPILDLSKIVLDNFHFGHGSKSNFGSVQNNLNLFWTYIYVQGQGKKLLNLTRVSECRS